MATLELRLEELAEQVVVAVPLAAIVERDDERVRARERLERIGRVDRAEHRVAERWGHPIEDRRAEQERLEIVRLPPQDLLEEVVRDLGLRYRPEPAALAAASSRSRDESAASATPAAHPSVRSRRASASSSDSSRPPRAATARVSSVSRARSTGPDLAQIAAGAEAAAPHPRVAAGDQHQLGAGSHLARRGTRGSSGSSWP